MTIKGAITIYNIITQLLSELNANINLKAIVTRITPHSTTDVNTMTYKITPLTSNRIVAQTRLELTAICDTYKKSLDAIAECKITLLTLADNQFNNDIMTIQLNGGGSMKNEDTNTYHEKAFFTITYKERI